MRKKLTKTRNSRPLDRLVGRLRSLGRQSRRLGQSWKKRGDALDNQLAAEWSYGQAVGYETAADLLEKANAEHEPPEPAAADMRIATRLNGWLRSAPCSGSETAGTQFQPSKPPCPVCQCPLDGHWIWCPDNPSHLKYGYMSPNDEVSHGGDNER